MVSHLQEVCIIGKGRMGNAITEALNDSVRKNTFSRINKDNIDNFRQSLEKSDLVIDVSHADNIEFAVSACIKAAKPYFCGTTGLKESHFDFLQSASSSIPILYAANTSLGIAILKKAIALVAKALGQSADITISETHHRLKKDAPSGTALELGNIISQVGYPKDSIDFVSMRGGNIPGEHTVHFFHGDETIRLSHECLNRDVFASGAINAARWLFKQQPGFYSLDNMLEA